MRHLVLLLVFITSLFAATSTRVQDTILSPIPGVVMSGRMEITAYDVSSTTDTYRRSTKTITVTAGVVDIQLVPGVYKVVSYLGGRSWNETWIVPVSGTPVTVRDIVSSIPLPTAAYMIQPRQINPGVATPGQLIGLKSDGTVGYLDPGAASAASWGNIAGLITNQPDLMALIAANPGPAGIQGPQGIQGIPGVKGDTGLTGSQGIQGVAGIAGADGAPGIQGVKGDTGNAGAPGSQGIQGIQGLTGPAGVASAVSPIVLTGTQISCPTCGTSTATGNMTNTGTPAVSALPRYTSTTGTDMAPSTATVDASGNLVAPGTVTAGGSGSGSVVMSGSASGSAKITVAAAAGTPNDLVLPILTGTNGYLLSTDGGSSQQLSWVAPFSLPTQTGNSGKVLGTNGTVPSWVDQTGSSLPTQTGNSGKYLTTNGTTPAWADVAGGTIPITTKGDLFTYGSAAARLPVGADGYQLKANSATATGLEWVASTGGGDVASTSANSYTAGAKQTVAASATTAGLKITPAALPSTPVAGDMAVDSADANKLKIHDGTGWQTAGGSAGVSIGSGAQGYFMPFGHPQVMANSGVMVANRVYYAQFIMPYSFSTADIGVRVQTAAASGTAVLTIGLYDSSCNKITEGSKTSGLNVAGYYKITYGARQSLAPGVYFLAWSTDDATLQLSSTGLSAWATFSSLQTAANYSFFYGTNAMSAGSLPASCGTRQAPGSVGYPHVFMIP